MGKNKPKQYVIDAINIGFSLGLSENLMNKLLVIYLTNAFSFYS